MRIVLFGPPGAGKGTQSDLLVRRCGLVHITTGGLLREAIRENTEIGRQVGDFVEAGQLAPGPLVRKLAEDAVAAQGYDDFILDGYPRTVEQARWLGAFLDEHDAPITAVISLRVPDERIVQRLSKRRVHLETGENYHLDYRPPPPDVDPDLIVQRPDDKPNAIRERLHVYHRQTEPVEACFQNEPCYHQIDGMGEVEDVHERIVAVLDEDSC